MFEDMEYCIRIIGVMFLVSDYTKYALGFFQLASMAELTIVIRQSVYFIKQTQRQERRSIGSY